MNFTREPIVETVITPKEGYKLVVRNSKGAGQEEFFVDALEVVVFGKSSFYRSLEKPKSFLVPVNDYEILEVREVRMSLKSAGVERVKIGGGKQPKKEKEEVAPAEGEAEEKASEKKRERRRTRKRKEKVETHEESKGEPSEGGEQGERPSLIPPPPTLIADTMIRIKKSASVIDDEEDSLEPPPPPPPPEEPEAEVSEPSPQ